MPENGEYFKCGKNGRLTGMTPSEITTRLAAIKGVLGVSIVDYGSGMMMAGKSNDPSLDLEVASAGCVNIIRAKMKILKVLDSTDTIHDIQINLHKQYHLMCPSTAKENTVIFMVADRAVANLSICRRSLFAAEKLVDF